MIRNETEKDKDEEKMIALYKDTQMRHRMENYNSDDFAGIRYNVLKEIVAENGLEKVIEYAMDSCDTILLGDLIEIASSIMTKDQLLRCYIRIKDAYDFKIKALKAQNENLKNIEKRIIGGILQEIMEEIIENNGCVDYVLVFIFLNSFYYNETLKYATVGFSDYEKG